MNHRVFAVRMFNIMFMVFFPAVICAQTVIFQSGFETGDPTFTYSCGSCTGGLANGTTNPRTGTNAGFINGGSTKSYDGSIITGSQINFLAGKYYVIEVWASIANCNGSLDIIKSATNTNAAMVNATGADIILNGNINVTTVAYTRYSATFQSLPMRINTSVSNSIVQVAVLVETSLNTLTISRLLNTIIPHAQLIVPKVVRPQGPDTFRKWYSMESAGAVVSTDMPAQEIALPSEEH